MSYVRWAGRLVVFGLWYALQVLKANAGVVSDILTPGSRVTPGFVELPLRSRTDLEITTIANLITLTPGTVTVSTRKDPATLWVHGMYVTDLDDFRRDLHAMEGRMLVALRRSPEPGPVPARASRKGART